MEGEPPSNPFFLFEEGLYTKKCSVAGIAHCVSGDPKAESPLLQFTQDLLQGTGGGSESLYGPASFVGSVKRDQRRAKGREPKDQSRKPHQCFLRGSMSGLSFPKLPGDVKD